MKRAKKSSFAMVAIGTAALAIVAIFVTNLFQPKPYTQLINLNSSQLTKNKNFVANSMNQERTKISQKATINLISTTSASPFVQRWVAHYDDQEAQIVKSSVHTIAHISLSKIGTARN